MRVPPYYCFEAATRQSACPERKVSFPVIHFKITHLRRIVHLGLLHRLAKEKLEQFSSELFVSANNYSS